MNKREFSKAYPSLDGALAGEFQYPDGRSDEDVAHAYISDLSGDDRIGALRYLLNDCYRLLPNIDAEWEALAHAANRRFDTPVSAKQWLNRIISTWERALLEEGRR
jgi:hypothetical protein